MNTFRKTSPMLLIIAALVFASGVFGQGAGSSPKPLFQDLKVQNPADSTPSYVNKTGSTTPTMAPAANLIKSSIPILAETTIPGHSGVLVETLEGNVVVDSMSNFTFNPASNVKIATSYAVLKTFGPEYRFQTGVWTDGSYEKETQTLHGNLYVSGRDPIFGYEHGVALAAELNRMGIRTISGDLVVTDNFAMNYSTSAQNSG